MLSQDFSFTISWTKFYSANFRFDTKLLFQRHWTSEWISLKFRLLSHVLNFQQNCIYNNVQCAYLYFACDSKFKKECTINSMYKMVAPNYTRENIAKKFLFILSFRRMYKWVCVSVCKFTHVFPFLLLL